MGIVANQRQFVTANAQPMVRYEMLEGRQHMVVPMVMITEGVHAGSNGPLYYPRDELQKGAAVLNWNHKPVVVYHPTKNGESISACEPTVLTKRKVGVVLNTKYEPGKGREPGRLKAEAWLETNKLKAVDERVLKAVLNKEMMEVSTGVFTDNEQTPGQWHGEDYHSVARNYRADHLAILPDQKGSCSIADGAGLLRNSDMGEGGGEEEDSDPTKKKPEDGGESPEMTGNELTNNGNRFHPDEPGKESDIPAAAPNKVDMGMVGKGYRYRMTPKDGSFAPLYAKQIGHIGPVMRDYPDTRFDVHDMRPKMETPYKPSNNSDQGDPPEMTGNAITEPDMDKLHNTLQAYEEEGRKVSLAKREGEGPAKHFAVVYRITKDRNDLPVWKQHTHAEITKGQYGTLQKRGYPTGELHDKLVENPPDDWMTGNSDQGDPPQVIQGMPAAVNLQKKIEQACHQSPTLPSKLPNDGTALWIANVYPTFAIFHWKGQQYSQPYDVNEDDGHVTLKGNPEMVAPTFKTVTGKVLNTEAPMTKAQIVNALIANRATRWAEADRPALNKLDGEILAKMLPRPVRNGSASPFPMTGPSGMTHSPDAFGTDGHDDDNGETVEGQADAVKPGGARRKPPQLDATGANAGMGHDYDTENPDDEEERMPTKNAAETVEEYICNAPAGMREVLQTSYKHHNRQKSQIIRTLTANKNCRFNPQFLANKSLEELQLMLDLAGGNKRPDTISMNYSGMGDGGGGMAEDFQANGASTEEALVPPTLNFAKREV